MICRVAGNGDDECGGGWVVVPFSLCKATVTYVWPKINRFEAPFFKATRGRLKLSANLPMVVLTSVGARSGEHREVPLAYFTDGDDVVLIASNYGGTRHPAWYHNLRVRSSQGKPSGPAVTACTSSPRTGSTTFSLCTTREVVKHGRSRPCG